jgi:hypothetical protein
MSFRCRRSHLLVLVPLLAVYCIIANISLYIRHDNDLVKLENVLNEEDDSHRVLEPVESVFQIDESEGVFQIDESVGEVITKQSPVDLVRERRRRNRASRKQTNKGMTKKKQFPIIEPTSQSLSPDANFSACLLIKDDNEILNEWIAYHYHVLKMRRLVVAVDPLSIESPSLILDKWRDFTDLEVFEWNDERYMPGDFLKAGKPPKEFMQQRSDFNYGLSDSALIEISNHRYRQRVFLSECMRDLRDRGSSWVIHIDTDEYVATSKLLRELQPDYVTITPMEQPGSILDVLQQAVNKTGKLMGYPCISILRVLFGAVESSQEELSLNVTPGFDPRSFESLRWRYHAQPQNMSLHGNPKVILDVSAIPEEHFPKEVVYSIHRPVEEYCKRNTDLNYNRVRRQPIAANHYLGSWERYSGRQDSRRNRANYEAKAFSQREVDDGVRPWLTGFVNAMGKDMAGQLLGERYLSKDRS